MTLAALPKSGDTTSTIHNETPDGQPPLSTLPLPQVSDSVHPGPSQSNEPPEVSTAPEAETALAMESQKVESPDFAELDESMDTLEGNSSLFEEDDSSLLEPGSTSKTASSPAPKGRRKRVMKQDILLAEFELNPIPDLDVLTPKLGMSRKMIRDFFSKRRRQLGIEGNVPRHIHRRGGSSAASSSSGTPARQKQIEGRAYDDYVDGALQPKVISAQVKAEQSEYSAPPHVQRKTRDLENAAPRDVERPKRSRPAKVNYNVDDLDDDEFLLSEPGIPEPPQAATSAAHPSASTPMKLESPAPEYGHALSSPMTPLSTVDGSPAPARTSTYSQPTPLRENPRYVFASSYFLPIDTLAGEWPKVWASGSDHNHTNLCTLPLHYVLAAYFEKNPWPTWDEIDEIRAGTELTRRQLGDWFSRHRRMNGLSAHPDGSAGSPAPSTSTVGSAPVKRGPGRPPGRGKRRPGRPRGKGSGRPRKKGHGWIQDDDENDYGSTTTEEPSDVEEGVVGGSATSAYQGTSSKRRSTRDDNSESEVEDDGTIFYSSARKSQFQAIEKPKERPAGARASNGHSTTPDSSNVHNDAREFTGFTSKVITYAQITRPMPGARPLTYFTSAPVPKYSPAF